MKIPSPWSESFYYGADTHSLYIDEIQHYGVLGMRWGVRKDRKTVGLTPEEIKPLKKEWRHVKAMPLATNMAYEKMKKTNKYDKEGLKEAYKATKKKAKDDIKDVSEGMKKRYSPMAIARIKGYDDAIRTNQTDPFHNRRKSKDTITKYDVFFAEDRIDEFYWNKRA